MPNHPPNPESVPSLRKQVSELITQVDSMRSDLTAAQRPTSLWQRLRVEHPIWSKVVAGLIVAAIVGVCTLIREAARTEASSYIDTKIDSKIGAINSKIDGIDKTTQQESKELATINGTIAAWAPFMTPQLLKRSASLPDKQFLESLPQLRAVVQYASENKTPAPVKEIGDTGKRTIALASANPDSAELAWNTTQALLRYRTVVNGLNPPSVVSGAMPIPDYRTKYTFTSDGMPSPEVASTSPGVPREQAAALDAIGQDLNKDSRVGPGYLILQGGNIVFDGMHMKNLVLISVHVIYRGGPLQMENIIFLNCTFQVAQHPNGILLADQIFTKESTSLSAS
jgi:hypothetical protein